MPSWTTREGGLQMWRLFSADRKTRRSVRGLWVGIWYTRLCRDRTNVMESVL